MECQRLFIQTCRSDAHAMAGRQQGRLLMCWWRVWNVLAYLEPQSQARPDKLKSERADKRQQQRLSSLEVKRTRRNECIKKQKSD